MTALPMTRASCSCSLPSADQSVRVGRYEGLTDAQRAVLEPPYHGPSFTDRPFLGDDGELDERSRRVLRTAGGWDRLGGNLSSEDSRPRRIARERKQRLATAAKL